MSVHISRIAFDVSAGFQRSLFRSGNLIDGLLGQDVLSRWPYTIDYEASRLTLSDTTRPTRAPTVRLPLTQVAGGLLALVPAPGGRVPLRLVPDTAADRIVFFRSGNHALPTLTLIEAVRVRSITGSSMARLGRVNDLDVGGIRLRDREGLLLDRGPADAAMGDGLLPLHLFARSRFDVAAGYLGARRASVAGPGVPPVHNSSAWRSSQTIVSAASSCRGSVRQVLRAGVPLPLITRYFDLLVLLIKRRQAVVTRREIFDEVWRDVIVSDGALTQAIRTLRRTLGDDSREPVFIRTVARHGYRFVREGGVEEPAIVAASNAGGAGSVVATPPPP